MKYRPSLLEKDKRMRPLLIKEQMKNVEDKMIGEGEVPPPLLGRGGREVRPKITGAKFNSAETVQVSDTTMLIDDLMLVSKK